MSSKPILQAIKRLLGDFPAFSRQVIKVPLYDYQLQVTQPIIESIQSGAGDEETRPDESSHIWGVRVRQLESQKQPTHQG